MFEKCVLDGGGLVIISSSSTSVFYFLRSSLLIQKVIDVPEFCRNVDVTLCMHTWIVILLPYIIIGRQYKASIWYRLMSRAQFGARLCQC